MKKKNLGLIAGIASLVVLFAVAGDVTARGGAASLIKKQNKARKVKDGQTFSVSGVYSGRLSGEMKINGRKVYVSDRATVWMIGEGEGKLDAFVTKRRVFVAGVFKKGVPVVNQILVRPSSSVGMVSMSSHSNHSSGRPVVGALPEV